MEGDKGGGEPPPGKGEGGNYSFSNTPWAKGPANWTSLQFNKNTVAHRHTDRNNLGLSWIMICGDLNMWVWSLGESRLDTAKGLSLYLSQSG